MGQTWRTLKIDDDLLLLAGCGFSEVDKLDVGDINLGRICGAGSLVDVEVALIQNQWLVSVVVVEVLVGDISDVSVASSWTCPGLQKK